MKPVFQKLLYGGCAVVLFVLLFLLLNGIIQPSGQVLENDWQVLDNGIQSPIVLPYRKSIDAKTTVVFSREIQYKKGDALILTRLDGQALEVRLDGNDIFSIGNPAEPTANIWNTTFLIKLPDNPSGKGILEISLTSASYPIDITIPPYILDLKTAQHRVALINLVYNDLLLFEIGGSLLMGIIMILLSRIKEKYWGAEAFLGIASILTSIESLDYVFSISLGSLGFYFFTKKVLVSAGYLGALAFVAGLEKYGSKKLVVSKFIAIPTAVTIILIALETDLTHYNDLIGILNSVLLLDFMIAIYFIFRNSKSKSWMFFLAVWLILGLLEILVVIYSKTSWPYVMQYIILLGTIVFGINLLLEFNRIYSEKQDLERRIVMDTLTTAYNRNILGKTSSGQYDVLIIMDLDNFKAYNDKHGHQQGDQLLIKFAEIIKNNLRDGDLVVRYGGDEFLVLLSEISIIDAEQVALRIRHDLEEATSQDHLSVSYGIEKMEHSLDSDLVKADRLMYAMKQAKQVQIKK
jgi:diguanylate cyclase